VAIAGHPFADTAEEVPVSAECDRGRCGLAFAKSIVTTAGLVAILLGAAPLLVLSTLFWFSAVRQVDISAAGTNGDPN